MVLKITTPFIKLNKEQKSLHYVLPTDLFTAGLGSDENYYPGATEACRNIKDLQKKMHIIHLSMFLGHLTSYSQESLQKQKQLLS